MANACPLLPSASHAGRLVRGDVSALPEVAFDVVVRAALIGAGMYVAGGRDHVLRNAFGGSVAIEAFVLLWIGATRS